MLILPPESDTRPPGELMMQLMMQLKSQVTTRQQLSRTPGSDLFWIRSG